MIDAQAESFGRLGMVIDKNVFAPAAAAAVAAIATAARRTMYWTGWTPSLRRATLADTASKCAANP